MANNPGKGEILKGVFYDSPVQGLEYETQTLSGITNEKGEFQYRAGETVTFAIGGLVLGSAPGSSLVTPAHLAVEVGGNIEMLKKYAVTSLARFLQSIDKGGNIEERIVITEETRNIVKKYVYKIDFEQTEEEFTNDANVQALFAELGAKLLTGAQARNHLRRTLYGIKKMTDVIITLRDGVKLYADVYIPIAEGKYPAILWLGCFGKCFHDGCICDEASLLEHEEWEDRWFEGTPIDAPWGLGPMPWEKGEGVNTTDWVPRGYAIVRIDSRGVCKSEGYQEMFSAQEARDFYDCIEWSAKQPWCDGNIGLWGTGMYGSNSMAAAQLNPPSLKAMIPICPDIDPYRDYIFIGGLWMGFNFVMKNTCGEWQGLDWIEEAHKNPFYSEENWGVNGKIVAGADVTKIKIPTWLGMSESGTLHTRGTSLAYTNMASKDKKMTIISEPGVHYWAYEKSVVEEHIAFMDYWLKGKKDNGIMDGPPIQMMVRTGRKGYFWQDENEWPIARTQYTKYYLNAMPSDYAGDGKRTEFLKLEKDVPKEEKSSSYSADVEWQANNSWMHGISFITEPMKEDVLLAGHFKLSAWVSSTTKDMALHCSLRVMDGENEVTYPIAMGESTAHKMFPVSFGALKVSHRKTDPQKSTDYRPYHTHLKEDYQPLKPGEIVPCEVEIWPTTALIRKGWRLRLDVQPVSGDYMPWGIADIVDKSYQKGSSNTIYTGPEHPTYLQLPVIPPKK
jgi:predicted acyl esterase